jgi:hypothetical protein
MRGEFLNESLFFGLDHDRSAIEHWVADFNAYRPHFALGYQTPADVWRDPGCSDEIPTILDVDDALEHRAQKSTRFDAKNNMLSMVWCAITDSNFQHFALAHLRLFECGSQILCGASD